MKKKSTRGLFIDAGHPKNYYNNLKAEAPGPGNYIEHPHSKEEMVGYLAKSVHNSGTGNNFPYSEEDLKKTLREISDYKYALDESSIVSITDHLGIIKHANDNFCRIAKYSEEELIGQDHYITNSGYHPKEFMLNLWTTIAEGKIWRGELKNKAKDGTYYWVDTTIVPFLNEAGEPDQYIAVRADITERKLAEENLKKTLREISDYKYALNESSIVSITDQKGIIKHVNDNFCRISKFSEEELIGQDHYITNSGYHSKEFIRNLWTTIAHGKIWRGELKNKAKDNTYYWVDTTIVPFLNEAGHPYQYMSVRTDITERKNVERKLEEANRELNKRAAELLVSNKELEQFAYVASHDLQEPLNTTSSFVELFQKQYSGRFDEKADKYLTYILQASDRMRILIKDLLDYSRIGNKKEITSIQCNSILNDVLSDLDTAIHESQAHILYGSLPVINCYSTEIKQLFQNLILNAIKFRKKDIAPKIKISAKRKHGHWEFAFEDNGIGIDEQFNDKIFVIFHRLHTRNEYHGSGIGLSHCKKIVELHNGKIWFKSKPGMGSTFYFTLYDNHKTEIT